MLLDFVTLSEKALKFLEKEYFKRWSIVELWGTIMEPWRAPLWPLCTCDLVAAHIQS